MKTVTFEIAKWLKDNGYPQDVENTVYLNNGDTYTFDDVNPLFKYVENCCCDAPEYISVWMWLWRNKKISIEPTDQPTGVEISIWDNKPCNMHKCIYVDEKRYSDIDDAIIESIKHLFDIGYSI